MGAVPWTANANTLHGHAYIRTRHMPYMAHAKNDLSLRAGCQRIACVDQLRQVTGKHPL